jgi:hypothetical protein
MTLTKIQKHMIQRLKDEPESEMAKVVNVFRDRSLTTREALEEIDIDIKHMRNKVRYLVSIGIILNDSERRCKVNNRASQKCYTTNTAII